MEKLLALTPYIELGGVVIVAALLITAVVSAYRMQNHKGDPNKRSAMGTRMALSLFGAVVFGIFVALSIAT